MQRVWSLRVEGKRAVGDREVFAAAWRELGLAGEPPEIDPVYADGGFRSPWAGEYPRARVVVDRDGSLHVERETLAEAPVGFLDLEEMTVARLRGVLEGLGLRLRVELRGERGYVTALLDERATIVGGPAMGLNFTSGLRGAFVDGIRRARDAKEERLLALYAEDEARL